MRADFALEMLPPPDPPVACGGTLMTAIRVTLEEDTARGWSHQVEIDTGSGTPATVTVQLSFQDYEYWSGGTRPPEQVTISLIECLMSPDPEAQVPNPLPAAFDASTARRWMPDLDARLRAGSWH